MVRREALVPTAASPSRSSKPSMIAKVLALSVLWCCVAVADASAATGALTQRPAPAGCVAEAGAGGCAGGRALAEAGSVTVSPDGKSAYVTSSPADAVAVFDRAASGELTQKSGTMGCIADTGAGDCADGRGLDGARSLTVSPDGNSAYVTSFGSGAVAVFDRAATGELTQKPGAAGCISETGAGDCVDGRALDEARSLTISPDGKHAYVTSLSADAVAVFDRAATGELTQKPGTAGCISRTGADGCAQGRALSGAEAVVVSPDGKSVYVAAFGGAVAIFDRAATGELKQKPGTAGCISDSGDGPCIAGRALRAARSVTMSLDGKSAYVTAAGGAVVVFDRAANGTLTQKPGPAGCIADPAVTGCADGRALKGSASVAVSRDGKSAYVASYFSDSLTVFDRAATGALTQRPGEAGCITEVPKALPTGACDHGTSLKGAASATVSPDGNSVYVASAISNAVALFDRENDPKPVLSGLRLSPSSFRATSAGPSIGPGGTSAGGTSIGTRVSYKLSEPAVVRFEVQRVLEGHNVGGKCVKPKSSNARTIRCRRYATLPGAFQHQGKTGPNRFTFTGRLPALELQPARYRLRAVATDLAGNTSSRRTRTFDIILSPPHIDGS